MAWEETHMKKMAIVVASLFLALGFLLATNAQAGATAWVKGTIRVAGATYTGPSALPVTELKCGDLEVVMSSKETYPPLHFNPVWQRRVHATGRWASGSCSYAVTVVPNSEFNVVIYIDSDLSCDAGYNILTSIPAQAGWFKLSSGDTTDQDFTVGLIHCQALQ
jgi:hypothetical protein